jgi:hypothetical protein
MPKALTKEEVVLEISEIKKVIEAYLNGSNNLPENFSYSDTVKRLQFLRNSLSKGRKKK